MRVGRLPLTQIGTLGKLSPPGWYDHYSLFTSAKSMATDEELPQAMFARLLSGELETSVDTSIELLQILANSLSNVIGEDGFESLLFRTTKRVAREFPWLQFDPRARPADPEFELFRLCFVGQAPDQVRAASILLFGSFVDILVVLLGSHLTKVILKSALGRARGGIISKEQHDG